MYWALADLWDKFVRRLSGLPKTHRENLPIQTPALGARGNVRECRTPPAAISRSPPQQGPAPILITRPTFVTSSLHDTTTASPSPGLAPPYVPSHPRRLRLNFTPTMGAGHSTAGRLLGAQPEDTVPLSPPNSREHTAFNSQRPLDDDSQDDSEAAALLEPVLPRLRRLKTFTVENLPKPHPLLKSKTQKQLVKSELQAIGIHIMNATCARSDRVEMEMKLCKYIASSYWPFPNQANAHLQIFETYRNALCKEFYRRRLPPPALDEQASATGLDVEQTEGQRSQIFDDCSYSNTGTVGYSETAAEKREGGSIPLRLNQETNDTVKTIQSDGRKQDRDPDPDQQGAKRGRKHVWWKEPDAVPAGKSRKNVITPKIDEDIGIKPFPRDPRAKVEGYETAPADSMNLENSARSQLNLPLTGTMNSYRLQDDNPETPTMSSGGRRSDTEGGLDDGKMAGFVSRSGSPPKRRRLNSLDGSPTGTTVNPNHTHCTSPARMPRTTSVMDFRYFLTEEEIEAMAEEQSKKSLQTESVHTQLPTLILRPPNAVLGDNYDDDSLVGSVNEDVEMETIAEGFYTFPPCRPENSVLRITNPDMEDGFDFVGDGAQTFSYDSMIVDGTGEDFLNLTPDEEADMRKALELSLEQQDMALGTADLLPKDDAEMQHALLLSQQTYEEEANMRQQELGEESLQHGEQGDDEDLELETVMKVSQEMYEMERLAQEALEVREAQIPKSKTQSRISRVTAKAENTNGKAQETPKALSDRPNQSSSALGNIETMSTNNHSNIISSTPYSPHRVSPDSGLELGMYELNKPREPVCARAPGTYSGENSEELKAQRDEKVERGAGK